MSTILFDRIVFGPVKSRRFGVSLGINLLQIGYKYCTFNCIYCECGWTFKQNKVKEKLPKRLEVKNALEERLTQLIEQAIIPDNITFAGNGEPTIHPEFAGIIEDTIKLRNEFFPEAEISVLSNASMLHKRPVFDALNKVNNNVLKLDTVIESTFQLINKPAPNISLLSIIENIKKFDGNQIIQTLFIRGKYNSHIVDNTTEYEVKEWIEVLKQIQPKYVMIYPIERDTAAKGLEKLPEQELKKIAAQVEKAGIKTKIYY
ncbi:MAG: radical SAM protein [Bacteroidales bacterium]|nr:radical SAM protein [Bacteroidales bacterium]